MQFVIDVHSHMMPGIDDGAIDMVMSREMIRMAYAEGCRHLFLTPHAENLNGHVEEYYCKMNEIKQWIQEEQLEIQIYAGTEIYLDSDGESIQSIIKKLGDGTYPTMNGTKYVLVEFYMGGCSYEEIAPMITRLIDANYVPVIAHAERYGLQIEELSRLKEQGCLLQLNLCDVYRMPENEINRMAHSLLNRKMIDLVGTDAHRIDRRMPKMKEYLLWLHEHCDAEYISDILYRNAMRYLGVTTNQE